MSEQSTCPPEEDLFALADGDPATAELQAHVAACPHCQSQVRTLRQEITALQTALSEQAGSATTITQTPTPSGATTFPSAFGNDYMVVGVLGRGGQAEVFRAVDRFLERDVAIKWIHDKAHAPDLLREGRQLAQIRHPCIVQVHAVGEHEGQPYLVMEYAGRRNFEEYARGEAISPQRAASMVAQLARGVACAHQNGVIHRDIKPGNVIVDDQGQPRLADFGIARWLRLDNDGALAGTPEYMAPEQLADPVNATERTDVYGLGGVLFFLLTNQAVRPWDSDPRLVKKQIIDGRIDWTALDAKKVPRKLAAICKKALAADPAQRYQRAEDLAKDLENVVRGPQILRHSGFLAASLAFLALLGGLYALFGNKKIEPPPRPTSNAPPLVLDVIRTDKDAVDREFELIPGKSIQEGLPLHTGDRLRVRGTMPENMKGALFAVTLSEPNFHLQEWGPLKVSGGAFRTAELRPLEASPATELMFLCAAADHVPSRDEVSSLLSKIPWRAKTDYRIPGNKILLLNELPERSRVGAALEDPENAVFEMWQQIQQTLRPRYFVSGVAFRHFDVKVPDNLERTDQGKKVPVTSEEGGSEAERKQFHEVMDRLLQCDQFRNKYPSRYQWQPKAYILPQTADPTNPRNLNAYAGPAVDEITRKVLTHPATGKIMVRAVITEAYMRHIVKDDNEILAAIMGHELGHITLGHLQQVNFADLEGLAVTRQQELEADLEGVRIAVAAGFSYKGGVRAAFREWKILGGQPGFHAIKETHPSWAERLAFLDKEQPRIWKAMAAFENGYFFLHAEQYRTAESCFLNVVDEFPDCAEAWANVGYARLMQYCDGLSEKDLRRLGIGQFAVGCFYARPKGLIPPRGDDEIWRAAVAALETAVVKDPNLVLARANLGLAYLVSPDLLSDKKTVAKATIAKSLDCFQKAYNKEDTGLDAMNLAAFLINFGVADLVQEQPGIAAKKFDTARKIVDQLKGFSLRGQLALALLYNEALLDARSPTKEHKARALDKLQDYLLQASPDSGWWSLAQEKYEKLAQELDRKPLPHSVLAERSTGSLLRVAGSVEIAPGKLIFLSMETARGLELLGCAGRSGIPIYRDSIVRRYFEVSPGVDLVGGEQVLAIFLTSDKAPWVYVQSQGSGSQKMALRVGMSQEGFLNVMKQQLSDERYVDNPAVKYLFFPNLGVGVRFADGHVREIAVAQIPRQLGFLKSK